MPNFFTHLAVAKRYAEKNNLCGDDARDFFMGNVYPDLEMLHNGKSKKVMHYNKPLPTEMTVENFCRDRVDFEKFFSENDIETPFQKGILLHLIVDNECYPAVLDMQKFYGLVQSGVRSRFVVNVTFDSVNDYLREKYKLEYDMTGVGKEMRECLLKWEKDNGDMPYHNLFDGPEAVKKLDDFIERISSIDLDALAARARVFSCDC